MKKIAIVTGASSGMGREFVLQIAQMYPSLEEIWVIARRKERLEDLKKEVSTTKIRSFALDFEKKESFEKLKQVLCKEGPKVCIIANGSGFGISGNLEHLEMEEISGMISLNCTALTLLTKLAIPYMGKGGYIYQFASAAAFAPQAGFSVYAATKAYVLSFSRALGQELRSRGIHVTAICPGPVKTEFFDIAYQREEVKFYKKLVLADPKKVVKKALRDGRKKKPVSVYGPVMKILTVFCKILPTGWIVRVTGK